MTAVLERVSDVHLFDPIEELEQFILENEWQCPQRQAFCGQCFAYMEYAGQPCRGQIRHKTGCRWVRMRDALVAVKAMARSGG